MKKMIDDMAEALWQDYATEQQVNDVLAAVKAGVDKRRKLAHSKANESEEMKRLKVLSGMAEK